MIWKNILFCAVITVNTYVYTAGGRLLTRDQKNELVNALELFLRRQRLSIFTGAGGLNIMHQKFDNGQTLLHYAVIDNNLAMITALIEWGAAVDAPDNDGKTPLHRAVYCCNPAVIDLLLKLGASVNVRDARGKTPLHYALDCPTIIGLRSVILPLLWIAAAEWWPRIR